MSKVLLEIVSPGGHAYFHADELKENQVDNIINGMFSTLKPSFRLKEVEQSLATLKPMEIKTERIHNDTRVAEEPKDMQEAVSNFVDNENKTPLEYRTGYKIKDGEKQYKCRYRCPKCGCTGNHYIPEGVESVDCHQCQTSMAVKRATRRFEPDKFLNWFVAGSQLAVSDFIYENAKKHQ